MSSTRREFLERVGAGAAMLGALPLSFDAAIRSAHGFTRSPASATGDDKWDVSWVDKLTGKHKAVFDCAEIESGYGVWRAAIWGKQYMEVLNIPAKELSTVIVLRHHGIALAMQQGFWDEYGIGKAKSVIHPMTEQPTDRNPALLSSARGEIAADFDAVALDKQIARGTVVLACNLAFGECVGLIQARSNLSEEAARKKAVGLLVTGVVLQPSGVFASLRAQEAGCVYLRSS